MFPILILLGFMQVQTFLVVGEPQVPCYFIFGDSLVDNGNNNGLTLAGKANYLPYGIDFPQGVSTGRFTNGLTIADITDYNFGMERVFEEHQGQEIISGELLGFDNFIPPYATASDQEISRGANYGSDGAGIRDETGSNLGEWFSFNQQLLNHAAIVSRLSLLHRNKSYTNDYLKKCIYTVNLGNDDYINNYFMPTIYPTSRIYRTDQYAQVLLQQYSLQLKTLYKLGARKIAVFSLAAIGCVPAELAMHDTHGKPCVDSINDAVKLFNEKLKPLVDELNNNYHDGRFTFINFTNSFNSLLEGSTLSKVPCCKVRADAQCIPNSNPCSDRSLYLFFDGFRPTEVTNGVLATRSYTALSPMDAFPYDISHLAKL